MKFPKRMLAIKIDPTGLITQDAHQSKPCSRYGNIETIAHLLLVYECNDIKKNMG